MSDNSMRDSLLDMFIFETNQLLEQLEEIVLESEKTASLTVDNINEIFRAMHTIKGSSAMMMYENISKMTHAVEDMFYFIRENKPAEVDFSEVADIVLQTSDFIKGEIAKITNNIEPDGQDDALHARIHSYLEVLRSGGAPAEPRKKPEPPPAAEAAAAPVAAEPVAAKPAEAVPASAASSLGAGFTRYQAHVVFDDNCQMENIRAFGLVHSLKDICVEIAHVPEELIDDEGAAAAIVKNGFQISLTTKEPRGRLEAAFDETMFLKSFTLEPVADGAKEQPAAAQAPVQPKPEQAAPKAAPAAQTPAENIATARAAVQDEKESLLKTMKQNQISVNIAKLDALMDLVGEIVINEAMVTHNPDLAGMQLDNFSKAARQLRKLTDELQDLVMSVRMIPVANTFHKMTRIVRDMGKRLDKDADLIILGEDTEVDKNIIDNLSDPLMHLIRNAMDHGIETREERLAAGKPPIGKIVLEAVNTGGDVLITIKDDGKGLSREKIIKKAKENGLLTKPENELSERDIYSLVLLPGFSTKEQITEFSGRGVGMDVVRRNIEKVGGNVSLDSVMGKGTTVTIKIPLTLAIVDGMMFAVGKSTYTVPTISIKEAFRPGAHSVVRDPDGHEMMMIRGNCYPIIRLHEVFSVHTEVTRLEQGIVLVVEANEQTICLFADRLMGEQQVVVKPLPYFLSRFNLKTKACIGGCTILGDGSISLILDTAEMVGSML